jgi:glycosyltransferase involved in cell wall biosynthesis
MLERVVRALPPEQFRSTVISMIGEGEIGPRLRASGFKVVTLGIRRSLPTVVAVPKLVRELQAFQPHVLQTWLYHADALGLAVGRTCKVPLIYWNIRCAELVSTERPHALQFTRTVLARLSSFPDAVIVNSMQGKAYHESIGYRPRRWEHIPNGFDTGEFCPRPADRERMRDELRIPRDAFVVGFVARFDVMKDHRTFLEAAKLVSTHIPNCHFVLAGRDVDESNQAIRALIHERELDARCHVLGERHDIPELHAAFDLAVLSSLGEGFPNSVGEAMSCGVPCVSTDVGDARSLIADTGRLVATRDPTDMAAAICALLQTSATERTRLGVAARQRIVQHFSLSAAIERYATVYRAAPSPPTKRACLLRARA